MSKEPMLLSIDEASQRLSIGRSLLYTMLLRGDLASVKVGKRRLVPVNALEAYVAGLVKDQLGDGEPTRVPIEA